DVMDTLANRKESNNLNAFKEFLENDSRIGEFSNAIQYGYNIPINVYNENGVDGVVQVNPSNVLETIGMGQAMGGSNPLQSAMGGGDSAGVNIWRELLDNQELLQGQYDTVTGRWPEKHNEVILIVDENNRISDYMLYALGLLSQDQLAENFEDVMAGKDYEDVTIPEYSYDDLLDMTFKLVLNTDIYEKNGNVWLDQREDKDYMKKVVENSEDIQVVGIMRQIGRAHV